MMPPFQTTIINIRGQTFEISNDTFNKLLIQTSSGCLKESVVIENKGRDEYFFERHPESFGAVLDYIRHGSLHLPTGICPNIFYRELCFWGVDVVNMENCCYHNYIMFIEDRKTLRKFEDQTMVKHAREAASASSGGGRGSSCRAAVWDVLDEPSSSLAAKIYMFVVILFVCLSVFVVVASTHQAFQRQLKPTEWKQYLGDSLQEYIPSLRDLLTEGELAELNSIFDYFGENETLDYDYDLESETKITPKSPPSNKNINSEKLTIAHARTDIMRYLEYVALAFFSVEFFLRITFCPSLKRYVTNIVNILDVLALCAMYVNICLELFLPQKRFTTTTMDVLQCIQFMRIFRFLRLVRNVTGFRVLVYSFSSSTKELFLLLLFLSMGILVFGSLMFYCEDVSNMKSIPNASWWALITMTTVGYGDLIPKTVLGRMVAAACAVSGVLLIAVTVPIFVNTFILFYSYSKVMDVRTAEAVARKKKESIAKDVFNGKNKIIPILEASHVPPIKA